MFTICYLLFGLYLNVVAGALILSANVFVALLIIVVFTVVYFLWLKSQFLKYIGMVSFRYRPSFDYRKHLFWIEHRLIGTSDADLCALYKTIQEQGLADSVIFHEWIVDLIDMNLAARPSFISDKTSYFNHILVKDYNVLMQIMLVKNT